METFQVSVGWLGFALVLASWVPQTLKTLRSEDARISRPFMILTGLGSVALAVHAQFLGDLSFTLLNIYSALNAALTAWYLKPKDGPANSP